MALRPELVPSRVSMKLHWAQKPMGAAHDQLSTSFTTESHGEEPRGRMPGAYLLHHGSAHEGSQWFGQRCRSGNSLGRRQALTHTQGRVLWCASGLHLGFDAVQAGCQAQSPRDRFKLMLAYKRTGYPDDHSPQPEAGSRGQMGFKALHWARHEVANTLRAMESMKLVKEQAAVAKAIADKAAVQLTYLMESPCARGVDREPGDKVPASKQSLIFDF